MQMQQSEEPSRSIKGDSNLGRDYGTITNRAHNQQRARPPSTVAANSITEGREENTIKQYIITQNTDSESLAWQLLVTVEAASSSAPSCNHLCVQMKD